MVLEDSYLFRGDVKNNNLIVEIFFRYELINEYDFCLVYGSILLFEKCVESEVKWYVNFMVDVVEDYYDMCIFERVNLIFVVCIFFREI